MVGIFHIKVELFIHYSSILTWWAEPKRISLNMNKIMKNDQNMWTKKE